MMPARSERQYCLACMTRVAVLDDYGGYTGLRPDNFLFSLPGDRS
jgi:hypothetical protein